LSLKLIGLLETLSRRSRNRGAARPLVEAEYFTSLLAGCLGRGENSPPQFGQAPLNTFRAQSTQNVCKCNLFSM
jgi:hypothetical protein